MWRKRQIMSKAIRHCCSGTCINSKDCEEKAIERWSKHPSLFVMIISNPMVIFGIGFFLGFLFGVI